MNSGVWFAEPGPTGNRLCNCTLYCKVTSSRLVAKSRNVKSDVCILTLYKKFQYILLLYTRQKHAAAGAASRERAHRTVAPSAVRRRAYIYNLPPKPSRDTYVSLAFGTRFARSLITSFGDRPVSRAKLDICTL